MVSGNARDPEPDLLVVGGGVVGLGVARDAALRGLDVVLLERGRCGRAASWAAAGMLSPLSEAGGKGPFLAMAQESLELWPDWARELEAVSGIDVEYRELGKLRVALSEEEKNRILTRLTWFQEVDPEARWLDAREAREVIPSLGPEVRGGILLSRDFRVDNRRLGEALEAGAMDAGVRIREGLEVTEILHSHGRVQGVRCSDGSQLASPRVLLAAGAWSAGLKGFPNPLPVEPVRGQMLSLTPGRLPSLRVLESDSAYLVPREDGRLLVGATVENEGFQAEVTAGGVGHLLAAAVALVPELESAPLTELWCGFRPGTPDGLPILGPHPELEGLLIATGHFRNGILLAPLTARLMGGLAAGAVHASPPFETLPSRFGPSFTD